MGRGGGGAGGAMTGDRRRGAVETIMRAHGHDLDASNWLGAEGGEEIMKMLLLPPTCSTKCPEEINNKYSSWGLQS